MLFPLVCSGCLNSIYFGVYDIFLRHLQSLRGNSKVLPTNAGWLQDLFIAGIIGGTAQALITCPSELIKIKMQVGKGIYNDYNILSVFILWGTFSYNLVHFFRKGVCKSKVITKKLSTFRVLLDIYRQNGIRGFFVGFVPTVWRFKPFVTYISIFLLTTTTKNCTESVK